MKRIAFLLCCFTGFTFLSAKSLQFDLTKYEAPELKQRGLSLNASLNNSDENNKAYQEKYNEDTDKENNSYSSSAKASFFSLYSTTMKEKNWRTTLQSSISSYDTETHREPQNFDNPYRISESVDERDYKTIRLFGDYAQTQYFQENGFYGGFHFYGNMYARNQTYNRETEQIQIEESTTATNVYEQCSEIQNLSLDFNPGVHFGYGKISNVYHARLAMYILQDLEDHNLLLKTLNDDEIIAFSSLITSMLNERFLDTHEKDIVTFEKILAFLTQNKIIEPSPKSSAIVFANWNELRKNDTIKSKLYYITTLTYSRDLTLSKSHGFKINLSITPKMNYSSQDVEIDYFAELEADDFEEKTTRVEKEKIFHSRVNSILSAEYKKLYGLNWALSNFLYCDYEYMDKQLDKDSEIEYVLEDSLEITDEESNEYWHQIQLGASFMATYDWSKKTSLYSGLEFLAVSKSHYFDDLFASKSSFKNIGFMLRAGGTYWVSKHLSVTSDISYHIEDTIYEQDDEGIVYYNSFNVPTVSNEKEANRFQFYLSIDYTLF